MGTRAWRSVVVMLAACGHPPAATTTTTTTTTATASSAPPAELRLPTLDTHRGDPRFLADRIYVFGRSGSRIAYLIEPADEACGCYQPEIVVQDLRTGRTVWKDSFDSGELAPADPKQIDNLAALWRARGADWERQLAAHGITREPSFAIETVPTGGSAVPRFEVHVEEVDERSPEGYAHLTSYRVDLVTSSGTSTITRSSSPETNLLGVELAGFVPARTSDARAAVLLLETRRGWEGPPSVHRLRVVGADVHVDPR